jgi:hypothetical protein
MLRRCLCLAYSLDAAKYEEIRGYYAMRWQFPVDEPPPACAYRFKKAYGLADDASLTKAAVSEELEGARSLLENDFEALGTVASQASQKNLTEDVLPQITSTFSILTDEQTCQAFNYGFKWCAEYRR